MSNTQTARILESLESGAQITSLDALSQFGCFRLAARIKNLRDAGHQIVTERVTDGEKSYARYSM